MLTLFLLRHAKSSWSSDAPTDRARPLNKRGRRAAGAISQHLRHEPIDLIACSTAKRTRQTIEPLLAQEAHQRVVYSDALYEGDAIAYLDFCKAVKSDMNGELKSLMLVGHNPSTEDLLRLLAARDPAEQLTKVAVKYPTGALARLSFAADRWIDVEPASGTVIHVTLPTELGAGKPFESTDG
ncbi:MAG: histidine phosphatase family protein [Pseudomonadota bacterium]